MQVGSLIGVLPTILAVVGTAFLGVTLLKQQGYQVLFNARSKMASGALPGTEVLEGFMLAVGGALLLTPGFVTDAIGFSLLIPGLRQLWIRAVNPKIMTQNHTRNSSNFTHNRAGDGPSQTTGQTTIDGEYRRED